MTKQDANHITPFPTLIWLIRAVEIFFLRLLVCRLADNQIDKKIDSTSMFLNWNDTRLIIILGNLAVNMNFIFQLH